MALWFDFLEVRKQLIEELLAEGKSCTEVAQRLSMTYEKDGALVYDAGQVWAIGGSGAIPADALKCNAEVREMMESAFAKDKSGACLIIDKTFSRRRRRFGRAFDSASCTARDKLVTDRRKPKLTPEDQEAIRSLYYSSGQSMEQLARMFKVSASTIASAIEAAARRVP